MVKIIRIEDDATTCCWSFHVSNARICLCLSLFQIVVAIVAFAQHIYSVIRYQNIFLCWFGEAKESEEFVTSVTTAPRNRTDAFLAADVIIFDFGLFHELLGIPKCVANRFDGGYLRAVWCLSYIGSLTILVSVVVLDRPRPKALLPILFQQSIYMLGLLMLTLATVRKLLWALFGAMTFKLMKLMLVYLIGGSLNCYFGITLWHLYWYWKTVIKSVGVISDV